MVVVKKESIINDGYGHNHR